MTQPEEKRLTNRRYGIECAHDLADAFDRDPERVGKWLEALPDDPGFSAALEWVENRTPNVVDAMKRLRRHFVVRAWSARGSDTIEFRTDTAALDNAWDYALHYAGRFADQDDQSNPMELATPEEFRAALQVMRRALAGYAEGGQQ